jgi:hypothetical protein
MRQSCLGNYRCKIILLAHRFSPFLYIRTCRSCCTGYPEPGNQRKPIVIISIIKRKYMRARTYSHTYFPTTQDLRILAAFLIAIV